jgi:GNAT superfamily N-acetyltransferase
MSERIVVVVEPTEAHRRAVAGPLGAFNAEAGFPVDNAPVAILLEDDTGNAVGGLWARTGYGWLFVELLVVPERLRGAGFGARLMQAAEDLARQRGCVGAWLTTFTFQARGFYERLGYALFAELENSPGANTRMFLRKRLDGDAPPGCG